MSKTYVKVKKSETVQDVLQTIAEKVRDPKNDKFKPGQYVLVGEDDSVLKVVTVCGAVSRTEQSYKDDLDINRLLEPAIRKGLLRHVTKFEGEYDDIPAIDFQEAHFKVAKALSMFQALPSKLRNQFEGDPGKFLSFVQDPANEGWLRKHGIIKGIDGLTGSGAPTGYDPRATEGPSSPGAEAPAPEAPPSA